MIIIIIIELMMIMTTLMSKINLLFNILLDWVNDDNDDFNE